MKIKSILVLLSLVISTPVMASQSADDSSNLCDSERCAQLMRKFERYGNNGHSGSMTLMAVAYANGEGVEQDDSKARMWMREAVRNRSAMAAYVKAQWRRQGFIFEQDEERAEWLIDRAIESGYPLAMYDRSVRLMQRGEDIGTALSLLEQAADEGLMEATYLLARLIETGQYYQQDVVAAGLIYRDLAVRGFKDSRARLNNIVAEVENESTVATAATQNRDDIVAVLTEYDDMEVITVTGHYASFEDHLASIQQDLHGKYQQKATGTNLRRMRPCGPESGLACQVIFDRSSNMATDTPYTTLAGALRMPGGF